MKTATKNTLVAFMIAVLLAPGFYLGVAPTPTVEAQSEGFGMEYYMGNILSAGIAVSACMFGSVINGLLDKAGRAISRFLTGLAEKFVGSIFSSFFKILTGKFPIAATVPVYVSDTNFQLQGAADATMSMEFKECVLDGIVWVAKRILIDTITASVMDWIGKGFFEGPVFVRDPGEWARALAFSTMETFLGESGVEAYLCEPFRDDIIHSVSAIANQPTYGVSGKASCNEEAYGGPEGYTSMVEEGTLTERGFLDALGLAEEGNNLYSAIYNLQSETAVRVNSVVASEMTILNYGDGYHSDRCSLGGEDFGICTPGQYIAKQVDDWAGGALGQLEVADEVSEIVDALFAHLTEDVFFDAEYGLLRDAPDVDDHSDASVYEGGPAYDPSEFDVGEGSVGGGTPSIPGGGGSSGGGGSTGGGSGPSGDFNISISGSSNDHGLVFSDIYITSGGSTIRGSISSTHGSKYVAGAYGNFTTSFSAQDPGSGTLHLILDSHEGMANGENPRMTVSGSVSTTMYPASEGYSKGGNRDIRINF